MADAKPTKIETEFKADDKAVKLVVHKPSPKDNEAAQLEYSKAFAEHLRGKVLLLDQEVLEAARDRGLWGKAQQAEAKRLAEAVQAEERVVRGKVKGTTKSEGRAAAVRLFALRRELRAVDAGVRAMQEDTVERKAGTARWDALLARCTRHADSGKLYFGSKDDVAGRPDDDPAKSAAGVALMRLEYDYDPAAEFAKRPEVAFLLKYKFAKMVDDAMLFTDPETGAEVDEDGKPVEKAADEPEGEFEFVDG
jgi:hypothetical protein